MTVVSDRMCLDCHADVDGSYTGATCPACGGSLVSVAKVDRTAEELAGRTVDHRGILLPGRHAVGGIITPR